MENMDRETRVLRDGDQEANYGELYVECAQRARTLSFGAPHRAPPANRPPILDHNDGAIVESLLASARTKP